MISCAVVMEHYETGIEAPILRNWKASSDSRCASTAGVKEIHVARGDGESCVAAGACVVKIRYPEVGVDRCIAGAAPVEEIRRSTVGDGGVASRGRAAGTDRALAKVRWGEIQRSTVDGDRRLSGGAVVVERNATNTIDGDFRRIGRPGGF
jgi:hypothetical protein